MPDLQSSPKPVDEHNVPGWACLRCVLSHSDRDAAWVRLGGELDLTSGPELAQSLRQALGGSRVVVVDLRQLAFMDSAGVHVIVDAHNRARRAGRRLVIIRGPGQVTRLLDLTGFSDRLEIVDLDPRRFSDPRSPEAA
jgi:anti-sigma B factor antagonist